MDFKTDVFGLITFLVNLPFFDLPSNIRGSRIVSFQMMIVRKSRMMMMTMKRTVMSNKQGVPKKSAIIGIPM